jgi:hypothetical protein
MLESILYILYIYIYVHHKLIDNAFKATMWLHLPVASCWSAKLPLLPLVMAMPTISGSHLGILGILHNNK